MKAIYNKESGLWLHFFSSKDSGMFMDDRSFKVNVIIDMGVTFVKILSVVVVVKL